MKKISIAMTTYNGEKFVLKQLKSLLVQSRQADEVIIFDDISTDNTPFIVREFIRKNNLENTWKFEVNEENLGFVKNFAKTLKNTTGDIIFFCDQDDIWHKDKIKIVENLFNANHYLTSLNTEILFIDNNDKIYYNKQNAKTIKNIKNPAKLEKINKPIKNNICSSLIINSKIKNIYLQISNFKISYYHEINNISITKGNFYKFSKPLTKYRVL